MTRNRLTQPINRFEGMTAHEPRPNRQLKQWRYIDEGQLVRAQDDWDASEQARQHWAAEGNRIDREIAERHAAEEKAQKDRDDAVIETVFRDRYLAAGGDLATFEQDLPDLKREHAKRVALGLDEPVNSMAVLKRELKALRGTIGAAPEPERVAS